MFATKKGSKSSVANGDAVDWQNLAATVQNDADFVVSMGTVTELRRELHALNGKIITRSSAEKRQHNAKARLESAAIAAGRPVTPGATAVLEYESGEELLKTRGELELALNVADERLQKAHNAARRRARVSLMDKHRQVVGDKANALRELLRTVEAEQEFRQGFIESDLMDITTLGTCGDFPLTLNPLTLNCTTYLTFVTSAKLWLRNFDAGRFCPTAVDR